MKIVVSATGPDVEAQVCPQFGRAPFFLLVDLETMECKVISNKQSLQIAHGAGIQAAARVARCHAGLILTGHCGPKAFHALQAAGIKVIVGVEGVVRDAVQKYRQGHFKPADRPDVSGHWG